MKSTATKPYTASFEGQTATIQGMSPTHARMIAEKMFSVPQRKKFQLKVEASK
jgi:hypothetical protein